MKKILSLFAGAVLAAGMLFSLSACTNPNSIDTVSKGIEYMTITGFTLVNLDSTNFPDGTEIVFNGSWCGWPEAWDGTIPANVATVTAGTATLTLAAPLKIVTDDFQVLCVEAGPNWANRIALQYRADAGNAVVTNKWDNASYTVVGTIPATQADGDVVAWTLKAN